MIDIVIINPGIGYNSATTNVYVKSRGQGGYLESRVRNLTVNSKERYGNVYLDSPVYAEDYSDIDKFSYNIIGYDQDLALNFNEKFDRDVNTGEFLSVTDHSPIIGWAYDGNPIYGPFGYTDPNDINSGVKILDSGYAVNTNKIVNRPGDLSNPNDPYQSGFFIEDYIYNESGDLDIHNGRFCKTPEFPNGIYAYFATVQLSNANKLEPRFPYFIGNAYKFPIINDNLILKLSLIHI